MKTERFLHAHRAALAGPAVATLVETFSRPWSPPRADLRWLTVVLWLLSVADCPLSRERGQPGATHAVVPPAIRLRILALFPGAVKPRCRNGCRIRADADISSLLEMLGSIEEPRKEKGRQHEMGFVLAGAKGYSEIARKARDMPPTPPAPRTAPGPAGCGR
jgi:hypothetical protein